MEVDPLIVRYLLEDIQSKSRFRKRRATRSLFSRRWKFLEELEPCSIIAVGNAAGVHDGRRISSSGGSGCGFPVLKPRPIN